MSAASRRKGVAGEREVAAIFEERGYAVRGLEGSGDALVISAKPEPVFGTIAHTLHIEVKRQERLRIPEWLAQAADEAPPGVPAVLCFRQSRGQWIACLPLSDLLDLIG